MSAIRLQMFGNPCIRNQQNAVPNGLSLQNLGDVWCCLHKNVDAFVMRGAVAEDGGKI